MTRWGEGEDKSWGHLQWGNRANWLRAKGSGEGKEPHGRGADERSKRGISTDATDSIKNVSSTAGGPGEEGIGEEHRELKEGEVKHRQPSTPPRGGVLPVCIRSKIKGQTNQASQGATSRGNASQPP